MRLATGKPMPLGWLVGCWLVAGWLLVGWSARLLVGLYLLGCWLVCSWLFGLVGWLVGWLVGALLGAPPPYSPDFHEKGTGSPRELVG